MKTLDSYLQLFHPAKVPKIKGKGTHTKGEEIHLFAYTEDDVRARIRMYVNIQGDISKISTTLFQYSKEENRLWIRNLRNKAIFKLGDKCSRCGIRDKRVLQFNHIGGGGGKEHRGLIRSNRNRFYQSIIEGKRNDINLLCANCNQIYEYEQGRRKE